MQSAKCKIRGENFDTIIPVGERLAAPVCFYGQSRTPVPTVYGEILWFCCLDLAKVERQNLNAIVGVDVAKRRERNECRHSAAAERERDRAAARTRRPVIEAMKQKAPLCKGSCRANARLRDCFFRSFIILQPLRHFPRKMPPPLTQGRRSVSLLCASGRRGRRPLPCPVVSQLLLF